MKIKIIAASILTALSLILMDSAFCKEYRKIPSPSIKSVKNPILSKGGLLEVEGSGFISNLPNVHKAYLIKKGKKNKKTRKIKLRVIESTANTLTLKLPEELNYNDYDLFIRIRTRLLKSKFEQAGEKILVRPKAPKKPSLNYELIENPKQLELLLNKTLTADANLLTEELELKIGANQLRTYYIEDGYESIKSEPSNFYYIPNNKFIDPLLINSEKPIDSLALSIENDKVNVSKITKEEILELEKNFYLISPSNPRYLENKSILSPVFIESLHVKSPEYLILKNRSSKDFNLDECYLTDSIKSRYSFQETSIKPKSDLKIESNLGLNDNDPDKLSLYCPEERFSGNLDKLEADPLLEDGFILIDSFKYESLDEEGFAEK